jgi:homopolymeric O-antigen transport system permease protein
MSTSILRENVSRGDVEAASAPVAPRNETEVVVEASSGWQTVDLSEIYRHRDLLWNLIWRNIKGRYAQSALGLGWVVVQPLLTLLIFGLVFGRVVRIRPPGDAPYLLFVFCGLVPWTYFSSAMMAAAGSLISEINLFTKVYFPRLILPLTQVFSRMVDLAAMLLMLAGLTAWFGYVPRLESVVVLPLLMLTATISALGVGFWLAALAVQYRDIAHAMGFLVQIWMYLSPVIYPASLVPERYQLLYGLNPMVGVISGFRACILGVPAMPWIQIVESVVISVLCLVAGALFFRRTERVFADVA